MTTWPSTWGSSNSHFGRRQEGLSKMMAFSVFLHLFFFAFLVFNRVLWKMRQPAFQGFQVSLVSPGSGLGVSGGVSRPSRSRSSLKTVPSKSTSAKKISVTPKRASTPKQATKSLSVQSTSKRIQKIKKSSPPPPKDDPERLEEWWKKQTKALKVPTTSTTGKVTKPPSISRRTAKIDIERKSIVVPPVALPDQAAPKSVPPPGQVRSGSTTSSASETSNSEYKGDGSGKANGEMASLGSAGETGVIGTGGDRTGMVGFKFPGYLQKIDNKIRWQWAPPPVRSREDSLILRFDIKRNGSIDKTSIVVEESSGNTFFDQAAIRAIHAAHPFPPLPENYSEDLLRVFMNFVVQEES